MDFKNITLSGRHMNQMAPISPIAGKKWSFSPDSSGERNGIGPELEKFFFWNCLRHVGYF